MAITVKHSKVSTIPDDANTDLVRPSDWNADHTLVGLGTMAEQNANNVNITGGTITGVSGFGDVTGPASSTDNAIARFNGTTGKLIQNSAVIIDDSNNVTGVNTLTTTNLVVNDDATLGGSNADTVAVNGRITTDLEPNADAAKDIGTSGRNWRDGFFSRNLQAEGKVVSPHFDALNSAGGQLRNSGGTPQIQWGAGGGNNVSVDVAININPANSQVDISPTGTGTVKINPATAGTINNTSIGATTPSTVNATTITATDTLTLNKNSAATAKVWSNTNSSPIADLEFQRGTATVWGDDAFTDYRVRASGGNFIIQSKNNATSTLDLLTVDETNNALKFSPVGVEQMRVIRTASAVNFVQVTGGIAGTGVIVSAQGSDTNVPLALQPKGTGALQAQATTSTTAGGNARGANAVDWQTSRASATQVASSGFSVIGGGSGNTASTSNGTTIAGGRNNNATAQDCFVGGGNANTASGLFSSSVGGTSNVACGYYGFVGSGASNSTTSNSAVTTQSATMNGTTAVTLSGSNASIRVGQFITGTSIAAFTYVAAISGTSLTLSQAASGSSTSTLSFFTPHGVVVGGGNNQATGSYSFIGGGGDAGTAANRNVASGDWSTVGGGFKNVASAGQSAILGGDNNTASGTHSTILCGTSNTASNTGASVLGGYNNTANGAFSTVIGRYAIARGITGSLSVAACNRPISANNGISQMSFVVLARQTTDATPTALCSDSSAASGSNQVILPNNSAYFFRGEVISGKTAAGDTKGWTIEGVIKRGANAASTALVGIPTVTSTYADLGAATWDIAVTADTTNGGIRVTFTGQAATTIRTVCRINTVEMTF
jgi:hypothetical protein